MGGVSLSGSALRRISPHEPPVEQIHATLRAAILSLELAPGERVSEAGIARAVGASRTPVRAALAQLGGEGLIETRPSRGNYVTRLSAQAVRSSHFMRDALESAAVAVLARDGLPAVIAVRLDANLQAASDVLRRGELSAFGQLDEEFHKILAEATGHFRLVKVLTRESSALARLRALCPLEAEYLHTILDEHTAIVCAVRARDEALARQLLSAHVRRVLTTLDRLQRERAEFFEDEL